MNNQLQEKIEFMIDDVIQAELRYDTDYITNDGWNFLENIAPKKILENILKDEDFDDISKSDIENYLADIIFEYEQINANIRYYN